MKASIICFWRWHTFKTAGIQVFEANSCQHRLTLRVTDSLLRDVSIHTHPYTHSLCPLFPFGVNIGGGARASASGDWAQGRVLPKQV